MEALGIALLSALVASITGGGVQFCLNKNEKWHKNKSAAIRALIILTANYNEFLNIKKYLTADDASILLISESNWRLSKEDILNFDYEDKKLRELVYALSLLEKQFQGLLDSVKDRNDFFTYVKQDFPDKRCIKDLIEIVKLTPQYYDEYQRLTQEIKGRLEKIEFKCTVEKYKDHIMSKYPEEKIDIVKVLDGY